MAFAVLPWISLPVLYCAASTEWMYFVLRRFAETLEHVSAFHVSVQRLHAACHLWHPWIRFTSYGVMHYPPRCQHFAEVLFRWVELSNLPQNVPWRLVSAASYGYRRPVHSCLIPRRRASPDLISGTRVLKPPGPQCVDPGPPAAGR